MQINDKFKNIVIETIYLYMHFKSQILNRIRKCSLQFIIYT